MSKVQDEVGSFSEEQLRKFGITSGDNQLTRLGHQDTVESRKIGSENAIVVQLPARRFDVDERDCYRIMLLAQNCTRCSFGDEEAGSTKELHLWLQVGSSTGGARIENADLMLPSKSWLAMLAATGLVDGCGWGPQKIQLGAVRGSWRLAFRTQRPNQPLG